MVNEVKCLFGHHEYLRTFDGPRMYLRCADCGKETEGWSIGSPTAQTMGTQPYWDTCYAEFMETELMLHGGG